MFAKCWMKSRLCSVMLTRRKDLLNDTKLQEHQLRTIMKLHRRPSQQINWLTAKELLGSDHVQCVWQRDRRRDVYGRECRCMRRNQSSTIWEKENVALLKSKCSEYYLQFSLERRFGSETNFTKSALREREREKAKWTIILKSAENNPGRAVSLLH